MPNENATQLRASLVTRLLSDQENSKNYELEEVIAMSKRLIDLLQDPRSLALDVLNLARSLDESQLLYSKHALFAAERIFRSEISERANAFCALFFANGWVFRDTPTKSQLSHSMSSREGELKQIQWKVSYYIQRNISSEADDLEQGKSLKVALEELIENAGIDLLSLTSGVTCCVLVTADTTYNVIEQYILHAANFNFRQLPSKGVRHLSVV